VTGGRDGADGAAGAGPATPDRLLTVRLFVDQLEGGTARVLHGEHVVSLDASLLPAGTREGDWVQLTVGIIPPPPSDADERRRRLAKDDPGGPLKL
jgi:hypothetical protein